MDVTANSPQLPLKAIVYATDFSACSENAGRYASLLARKFDADLLTVHSFVLTQAAMEAEAEANPPQKSVQRADLETALAAAAQRYGEGARRSAAVLLEGDPRERIPKLAQEHAPALIVLGTHGRGAIERSLVGSVAERILRAASGPSLTVGPHVPPLDADKPPFRRILFATGLSPEAARGATCAVMMATAFEACVDVLHVVHQEDVEAPNRLHEIQKQFAASMEKLVPEQARAICNPKAILEVGSAHERILEHLHSNSADLLVLSLRKSSHLWLQSRLSGAFQIVANAPCPVLTITG